MNTAYLCILIAAVLPYLWVGYAKFSKKGYNNKTPREYLHKLEGKTLRAHYAHLNAFEAFPAFAAGIIIAQLSGAPLETINGLAIGFIGFRILHGVFYILDRSGWRTVAWVGGFICVISLYILTLLS
jgi:uncharacterized MAPEG superfamily protein